MKKELPVPVNAYTIYLRILRLILTQGALCVVGSYSSV